MNFSSHKQKPDGARASVNHKEWGMPVARTPALAECASCPDCDKVLVLSFLPLEHKRPFVHAGDQGWVIICHSCGSEFPVRHAELFRTSIEPERMH
jgi:hypothetical protein